MIFDYNKKIQVLSNDSVNGFKLADVDVNEIVKLEIATGGEISEHALPIPVTFYVIRGEGLVCNDGKCALVKPGDVIYVEPGSMRSWKNKSGGLLEVLVIKKVR